MNAKYALALVSLCAPCWAQNSALPTPAEPKVQRTVIEDEGTRIEELRVRGQTQSIVVTSKQAGGSRYEIITGDGSRDLTAGPSSARGAVGQRVWRMFSF